VDWAGLPLPPHSWPPELAALIQERRKAKAAKDFARADALREEIQAKGYQVEDTPHGPRVYAKSEQPTTEK
jgi:cysteinyl-tRNA synthetase